MIQMKDHAFSQGHMITKKKEYKFAKFKSLLVQNHLAHFKQTWDKTSLGEGNSSFYK